MTLDSILQSLNRCDRALSLVPRFAVNTSMGLDYLDAESLRSITGVALKAHEAETLVFSRARLLAKTVRECEEEPVEVALKAWKAALESEPRHEHWAVLALGYAVCVIDAQSVDHAEFAALALARCSSLYQAEPNIGRMLIQVNDLLNNTRKFDEIKDYLAKSFCHNAFRHAEIHKGGELYVCCPSWLPITLGNIMRADVDISKTFSNPIARRIRSSFLARSFKYCNWHACPSIQGCELPDAPSALQKEEVKELYLAYDETCNLQCPSCRTKKIAMSGADRQHVDEILIPKLLPVIQNADFVKISGSGDPFASKHSRSVLSNSRDTTKRSLYLHTNALLFDKDAYEELGLEGRIAVFDVSIDAATDSTYAVVRKGGDFEVLRQRLAYVKELRDSGKIGFLKFSFVVQKKNFREMARFIEFAKEWNADAVYFSAIRNWGALSEQEYLDADVSSSTHPSHQEFLSVLDEVRHHEHFAPLSAFAYLMESSPEKEHGTQPTVSLAPPLGVG
jgi:molybdenum cofactor biosynthesis enzyme MoaA